MSKLLAILNVVAWAGFWSFGYLALSAQGYSERQLTIAVILAAAGLFVGIYSYLKLVRLSERSGYAKPSGRMTRDKRDASQQQWEQRHDAA